MASANLTYDDNQLPAVQGRSALITAVSDAVAAGEAEASRLQSVVAAALGHIEELGRTLSAAKGERSAQVSRVFVELADEASRELTDRVERQRMVLGTFNIALFGRTGAGKSSLVSALAELDGSRVSRGESDWTVDVEPVRWAGCLLYDTPGINGWGRTRSRADLEQAARRAVEVADIVLLCFDSQSQQAAEFAKVADWVQEYGKPVVAVLNTRNLMWRHPARVPPAARVNLSRAVQQHAGNIRDSLAAVGMPETPVVAIHARHALDARASQPYAGPDANNHHKRRQEYGPEYLYRWSNLPALQQLVASTVEAGGTRLRVRVLREGMRTTLQDWADRVGAAAQDVQASLKVLEEAVESTLAVLGYLERDDRAILRSQGENEDRLSELEDLRAEPFQASAAGRLDAHVAHLISSWLFGLRAGSLKRATATVQAAFDEKVPLTESEFQSAVFDDQQINDATAEVWKLAGIFLQRELDMIWDEAASDLNYEVHSANVDGSTGSGSRHAADALRMAGIASGAASTIIALVAATQFWNPAGWVAGAWIIGTSLLSGFLNWFGKKAQQKTNAQRLAARGQALADVRLAVEATYLEMQDLLQREIHSCAWRLRCAPLCILLDEALVVRRSSNAASALSGSIRILAEDIPPSPSPRQVLRDACAAVLDSRPRTNRPEDVWLGEDWLEVGAIPTTARAASAAERLGSLQNQDRERLVRGLDKRFSCVDADEVENWLREVSDASAEIPALVNVVAHVREMLAVSPACVVVGDYSAGKTSLVKRLLAEGGVAPPDDLEVRAEPATAVMASYPWAHLRLVDTPGLQSGRLGHDQVAVREANNAALVIVVLHVNLMIGDFAAIKSILLGTDASPGKLGRTIFLINRSDEFGVDPEGDPEEFMRRRARKEGELAELLAARGLAPTRPLIHTVAGDPFGFVAGRRPASANDYLDDFRAWDGIAPLVTALKSTANWEPKMRSLAALDAGVGHLLELGQDLTDVAGDRQKKSEAERNLLRHLGNAVDAGALLAASLRHSAEATVRVHAERAAAQALAAPSDNLEKVAEALSKWWTDPQMQADAVSFWQRSERDIDQWRNTAVSSLKRAAPTASELLTDLRVGATAPKIKRRGRHHANGTIARHGGGVAKVVGHRHIIYRIGKGLQYKFRPWGAVKGAARVAKVGAVLGVVSVAFDIGAFISDRKAEGGYEQNRRDLAAFVEGSIDSVTCRLTFGADLPGPLTVIEQVLAGFRDVQATLSSGLQERDEEFARLEAQCTQVASLITRAPLVGEENEA